MTQYPENYAPDSGEWVPHASKMKWQCCDCGLVHDVEFRLGDDGRLEVRMFRITKNAPPTTPLISEPDSASNEDSTKRPKA